MKDKAFHITSEAKLQEAQEAVKKLDIDKDYLVTIKTGAEKRRDCQHRLKWIWMHKAEKKLIGFGSGFSAEEWNRWFKQTFALRLLVKQDEKYVKDFTLNLATLSALKENGNVRLYNHARNKFIDNVKTEWLTVKNMWLFMESIQDYCAKDLGKFSFSLTIPDDLKWLSEQKEANEAAK